ncbi:hypothetical protein VTL71DRAFT_2234 [Oculimacula yallundae]|uniref:Uncharacterized protein n=1 Tax=Oculimacula yallundae TaxID=86028 RepID=A0ABR4C8B8_9HELO
MVCSIIPILIVLSFLSPLASGIACLGCGNCANDPNTFCDIDGDEPVCLPAEFLNLGGGCTAQVTQTTTITYITPTILSTSYISSVDSFVTVSDFVYVTAIDEETLTVQDVSTLIVTQTSTVEDPSITASPPTRRDSHGNILPARDAINRVVSTTIITVTTTDDLYCVNNPSDADCTQVTNGVFTNIRTTTVLATSTVPNEDQALVTETSVETSTEIETVTAAQETEPEETEAPTSESTPVGSASLATLTSTRQSGGPAQSSRASVTSSPSTSATSSPSASATPSSSTKVTPMTFMLSMMITSFVLGVATCL